MDTEATTSETARTSRRSTRARTGLIGAVAGAGAVVGSLALIAAVAGAQSGSEPTATAPTASVVASDEPIDITVEPGNPFDDEDFAAYDACTTDALVAAGIDLDEYADGEIAEPDLTDAEWEALNDALVDCEDRLPEGFDSFGDLEIGSDEADWHAYDECLAELGLDGAFDDVLDDDSGFVVVEDGDSSTTAVFGDGDGSVTITSDGGELTVTADGDVVTETFDWDALHEASEGCDEYLPEELTDDDWLESESVFAGDIDELVGG